MRLQSYRGNTVFLNSLVVKGSKIASADLNPGMPGYEQAQANQNITNIVQNGNTITISEQDGEQWGEYASSNPDQGTHEWVGLIIDTGEKDITKVTFNGELLTQADVEEAASVHAGAGKFVLWVKADDTAAYPRAIKLGTEGKEETTITVEIING